MGWNPVVIDVFFGGLNLKLNFFGLMSALTASVVYVIYVFAMVKSQGKQRPPISTWFLWTVLDVVAFCAQLARGIFDALLFSFVLGTLVIALFTIKYGERKWKMLDTICAIMVFIIIGLWLIAGPLAALICSLMGFLIAEIPLLKKVWSGAYEDLTAWVITAFSSVINILDGQVLTSICFLILQLLVICPIVYYWKYLPAVSKSKNS